MKKPAFTLAEVLITLGIIGIVAALTLPSLITKQKNKILEVRFKRTYNALANATADLISEEPYENWGGKGINYIETDVMKRYLTKIHGTYCLTGSVNNKICSDFPGMNSSTEHIETTWGAQIQMQSFIKDCSFQGFGHGVNNICLSMWVDTNGREGPNKAGYDRFYLFLSQRNTEYITLVPAGIDTTLSDTCAGTQCGNFGCQCSVTFKAVSDPYYFKNLK